MAPLFAILYSEISHLTMVVAWTPWVLTTSQQGILKAGRTHLRYSHSLSSSNKLLTGFYFTPFLGWYTLLLTVVV